MAGDNVYTMDDNGRVMIPVKFREKLGDRIQVARGIGEPCLYLYSLQGWNEQVKKILEKGSSKNLRIIKRTFIGTSEELSADKQGRITIPREFRTYANLSKRLAISDVGDHIEIWDKDAWEDVTTIDPEDFSALWEEFGL